MPLYYFDLKDGQRIRDHKGTELSSDEEALAHAKILARALHNEDLTGDDDSIVVVHEAGYEVGAVPVLTVRAEARKP
jgi:hypothetical protein